MTCITSSQPRRPRPTYLHSFYPSLCFHLSFIFCFITTSNFVLFLPCPRWNSSAFLQIWNVLQAKVTFEVWYSSPDGSAGSWLSNDVYDALDDDQQMLIDIEQNIANLERSFIQGRRGSWQSDEGNRATTASASKTPIRRGGSLSAPEKSPAPERKR